MYIRKTTMIINW